MDIFTLYAQTTQASLTWLARAISTIVPDTAAPSPANVRLDPGIAIPV